MQEDERLDRTAELKGILNGNGGHSMTEVQSSSKGYLSQQRGEEGEGDHKASSLPSRRYKLCLGGYAEPTMEVK